MVLEVLQSSAQPIPTTPLLINSSTPPSLLSPDSSTQEKESGGGAAKKRTNKRRAADAHILKFNGTVRSKNCAFFVLSYLARNG